MRFRPLLLLAALLIASNAFAQSDPPPLDFATAIDIPAADILSAQWITPSATTARRVHTSWGSVIVPISGSTLGALSTGRAATQSMAGYVNPNGGTNHGLFRPNPAPDPDVWPAGCSGTPQAIVRDPVELLVQLKVPAGVGGLKFHFNYQTAEYPEWVCTSFADRFVALLTQNNITTKLPSTRNSVRCRNTRCMASIRRRAMPSLRVRACRTASAAALAG